MQPIARIHRGRTVRQQLVCVLFFLAVFQPLRSCAQETNIIHAPHLSSTADIPLPVSQPMPLLTLELKRTPAQQAALDAFLAAAEQPGSATYRKWLTPTQFAFQFAPPPERVEAARQWLAAQGFQVGATSANGMCIAFGGTAQQTNRAFGTTLRSSNSGAVSNIAPDQPPTVPSALGDVVQGLNGFNTFSSTGAGGSTLLANAIESNNQSIVTLVGDASANELTPLLEQAAAQGITVFFAAGQSAGAPARLTALRVPIGTDLAGSIFADGNTPRPDWQSAPGLPRNTFRAAPDAEVADVHALANALRGMVAQRGERLGELAPALYRLADGHGIFTHVDSGIPSGTWSPTDGLGQIDVAALLKALATGSQASNLSLTPSSNTVTHGQMLTLTFTATGSSATPTGTVTATFKDRSSSAVTVLGPATLSATGTATLSTSTLPGDLYDLSGSYSGDTSYAPGTSNATAITVNPEAATLTATVPATATVAVGGVVPVTVSMTSASGIGTPSGTVTVSAFGTAVASTVYTAILATSTGATASATVSVPATDAGSFTFQANCTGNASYSCSAPVSVPVTVAKGTPVVTLTSTAMPAAIANSATTPYNLVASVAVAAGSNGSAPPPGGKVQVTDNGTSVASFNLVAGKGAYTLSLASMAHSLVAVYSGDPNYAIASSAAVAIAGTSITTTATITTAVTTASFGTAVPLTASVAPASYAASGAPTGTVTFTSSLQGVIGSARLGNGFVTYSPTTLIAGTHTITASYAPDSTDYAASATTAGVSIAITTAKVGTTTTVSLSPNPPFANQLTTLTAAVVANASTGASTPPPFTGTVSFFQNGVFLAQATVLGNSATANVRLTPGAPIPLSASYNGDTNYFGSTSAAVVVTPVRVPGSISLSSNLSTPNAGSTVVLTAKVIAANTVATTVPTGSITFYDTHGGVVVTLGTATLSANGNNAAFATFQVNGLAAGLHAILAKYNGDTAFTDASSNTVTLSFGDYNISFAPASMNMGRGSLAVTTATLSVSNSFAGTVAFGCTPPASSNITCSFSPASLTGGGQTTLTIGSGSPGTSAIPVRSSAAQGTILASIAMTGLLTFLLPSHRRRRIAALFLLLCSVALMSAGCSAGIVGSTNNTDGGSSLPVGGGGSPPASGTPYGTFLLGITTSSSDNSLRHSYNYSVTVQ